MIEVSDRLRGGIPKGTTPGAFFKLRSPYDGNEVYIAIYHLPAPNRVVGVTETEAAGSF